MWAYLALAAVQAVGGYEQAALTRQNGQLQQNIANMNAKYAELDAYNAFKSGLSRAATEQTKVDQVLATQKAQEAGAGVQVGYGTAAALSANSELTGQINALTIQRNARYAAMGYQTQAINLRLGGEMTALKSNLAASEQQTQGLFQAAGTTVSGYGTYYSQGKGNSSRTGTNDQSWRMTSNNVDIDKNLTNLGTGAVANGGNAFDWSKINPGVSEMS